MFQDFARDILKHFSSFPEHSWLNEAYKLSQNESNPAIKKSVKRSDFLTDFLISILDQPQEHFLAKSRSCRQDLSKIFFDLADYSSPQAVKRAFQKDLSYLLTRAQIEEFSILISAVTHALSMSQKSDYSNIFESPEIWVINTLEEFHNEIPSKYCWDLSAVLNSFGFKCLHSPRSYSFIFFIASPARLIQC